MDSKQKRQYNKNKPSKDNVINEVDLLDLYIRNHINEIDEDNLPYNNWGFNGKVPEYFEINTYKEILCARNYYKETFCLKKNDSAYTLVLSCMMHVLHGNRPYALSRNSHPLTPYKPTGDFIYKNVIEHIKDKVEITFKKNNFDDYTSGLAFNEDYQLLSSHLKDIDYVITSPPFADSIRFYINNWLRLWFIGWEPDDFKNADTRFLDGKQNKNTSLKCAVMC